MKSLKAAQKKKELKKFVQDRSGMRGSQAVLDKMLDSMIGKAKKK